ncbi:Mur ligase family protein [Limosilactobacillus fermentum]|nr:Mur ligase family protein [Limosilactobacillus fermentum]
MTLQIIDQVHIDTNSAISLLTEHGLLVRTENYRQHFFYHVEYNSKLVQSETLFFCKGAAFKEDYLNEAIDRGATAYVAEQSYQNGATALIVTNIQRAMALLSNAFYGFPSNDLFAIGITGTKGKTSTAYFAATALNLGTDDRTALISTLNTSLGKGDVFKSKLTTPESLDLFRYLRQAVDNGMTHLVMEVSSQSYLLDRVYSLHFGIGVFLNISSDHVGQNEHPDFANYLFCKEQLLLNSSVCVLNTQMDHFEEVYQAAKVSTAPDKIYLFGEAGSHPDLDLAYQIQSTGLAGSNFQLTGVSDRGSALMLDGEYQSSVAGDYNVGNATAAAICAAIGGVKRKPSRRPLGRSTSPAGWK